MDYLRQLASASLLDAPRIMRRLMSHAGRDPGWVSICNRHEELESNPHGPGVACCWEWTSDISACRLLPFLGKWIFGQALQDWPIRLCASFPVTAAPEVTFILPHRGAERLPLLHATIQSIAAQEGAAVECIVVEQDKDRSVRDLPQGARYVHLPHPEGDPSWRKSWAYNVGVAHARGAIVVCHDADILVPVGYAREAVETFASSALDALFLQRFLFCLSETHTERVLSLRRIRASTAPERIRQNWKGGTLAIRRNAFMAVGGFDESFVDWSGEDLEFYDRCKAIPSSRYGFLPFVHLWHEPQSTKSGPGRSDNLDHTRRIMASPREERIQRLVQQRATRDPSGLFD